MSLSRRLDEIEDGLSPREAVARILREIKKQNGDPKAVKARVTRYMEDHQIEEYNRLVEQLQTGCATALATEITIGEVPHLMRQSFMLQLLNIADDGADGMDRQVLMACYDRPVTESEHATLLEKARAETETAADWAEYLAETEIEEDWEAWESKGAWRYREDERRLIRSKEGMLRDLVRSGKLSGETIENGELRIPAGALHDWLGEDVIVMDESGDNPVGEILPDGAAEAVRMIRKRRERLLSVMREDRKHREKLTRMRETIVAGIAFDTLRIGAELRHYEKTMAKVEREIGEHPATEDLRSKLADALADVATVAEEIGKIDPEIGNAVDLPGLTDQKDEESGTFTVTIPEVIIRTIVDGANEAKSEAKTS